MRLQHKDCLGYERAISFIALLEAAHSCGKNVKWKSSVINWLFDKETRCVKLANDLSSNNYKLQPYLYFNLKGPKPRLISSTKFTDRVVQRSLCDNGLYDMISKPLIYDNGACLVGKGLQFIFKRFIYKLRKYIKTNDIGYVVKCDIHHFFDDTPHEMLKNVLKKYIHDENMFRHVCIVIDSFKDSRLQKQIEADAFGKRGIGLGSQISQLLMLLYLNDLDHIIQQKLKLNTYVRYMDDMIMVCKTKEEANSTFKLITEELKTKGLKLNSKSKILNIFDDKIDFLKITFKIKNKKIKHYMCRKSISREVNKIHKMFNKCIRLKIICDQYNSWFGSNEYKMSKGQKHYMNMKFKTYYLKYIKSYENNIKIEV